MKGLFRQGVLWIGTAVIALLIVPVAALLGLIYAVSALVDRVLGSVR